MYIYFLAKNMSAPQAKQVSHYFFEHLFILRRGQEKSQKSCLGASQQIKQDFENEFSKCLNFLTLESWTQKWWTRRCIKKTLTSDQGGIGNSSRRVTSAAKTSNPFGFPKLDLHPPPRSDSRTDFLAVVTKSLGRNRSNFQMSPHNMSHTRIVDN